MDCPAVLSFVNDVYPALVKAGAIVDFLSGPITISKSRVESFVPRPTDRALSVGVTHYVNGGFILSELGFSDPNMVIVVATDGGEIIAQSQGQVQGYTLLEMTGAEDLISMCL